MIVYPVRAVTFDINGTLIHAPHLGEVYAEVLGRHGIEIEAESALRTVRQVWEEFSCSRRPGTDLFAAHPEGARGFWFGFIDRVCRHLGCKAPSPFAKAELFQRFSGLDPWEIYPDVRPVLAGLVDKGIRCGVISNWDDRLPVLLENLGLSEYFEVVVYSQAVGVDKPFPEIFQEALDVLRLPAQQVVHVGDRVREDVEGAQGVGMQAIHLSRDRPGGDLSDLWPLSELLPALADVEESRR